MLVTFLYEILAPLNFFERTVVMFLGGETKDWADAAATKANNKRVENVFMFGCMGSALIIKSSNASDYR
jgi:hypothetical protein